VSKIENTIICGDSLEVMRYMPDNSVDMVLADPPYGTTACKWDSIIPLEPMWEQLKRLIKPNGAIVMTASQPFTTTLIASNMKMFKYCWVWDKTTAKGHLVAKIRPMQQNEDVVVFGQNKINYYPIIVDRPKNKIKTGVEGKRTEIMGGESKGYKKTYTQWYPKTILKFKTERGFHPTQKPVALMEYLIKTYTNEGETVLDFAMGSGTTGVACVNLGRKFIGIEKDEKYFKIAENRIKELEKGQKGLFDGSI
jgi:site-specific DNA-methyltransferase (adenine-specific)